MASTTGLASLMEPQLQLISIDAEEGSEGSGGTDDDVFPLLSLPSGVENVILSFLSTGKGGLRNVLALRAVCRTTRSWVDNLPKSHADVVFSNAEVAIEADLQSLELFNSSSPPFGVTSLRLNVTRYFRTKASREDDDEWSRFCSLWRPKLERLEVDSSWNVLTVLSRRLSSLLESAKISSINCKDLWKDKDSGPVPVPLPSCFQKVAELRMGLLILGDLMTRQFYSQLLNNNNLRVFKIDALGDEDLEGLRQLVDRHRECPLFQLNINFIRFQSTDAFCQLAQSILASQSRIRLKFKKFDLEGWILPRHDTLSLFKMVEVIKSWAPTEDTLSLLEDFPRLREVNVRDSTTTAAQLSFPASVEKLSISGGFPSCRNLPVSLKTLRLLSYTCDISQFVDSMNLLSGTEIEEIYVKWNLPEERDPILTFAGPAGGFSKLRSLAFTGSVRKEDLEDYRVGIANALRWQNLELDFLRLRFQDSQSCSSLPLLDEEILRQICEGRSGKSLLNIKIADEDVTPEGLPVLEKLRSLAAENQARRLKCEGKGRWQRPSFNAFGV